MGFWLEGLPLNKRWLCGGQPNLRCDSVRTSESEQLVPAAAAAELTVIIIITVILVSIINITVNIIIGHCWIVGVIVVISLYSWHPCLFHRHDRQLTPKMAKDFSFYANWKIFELLLSGSVAITSKTTITALQNFFTKWVLGHRGEIFSDKASQSQDVWQRRQYLKDLVIIGVFSTKDHHQL